MAASPSISIVNVINNPRSRNYAENEFVDDVFAERMYVGKNYSLNGYQKNPLVETILKIIMNPPISEFMYKRKSNNYGTYPSYQDISYRGSQSLLRQDLPTTDAVSHKENGIHSQSLSTFWEEKLEVRVLERIQVVVRSSADKLSSFTQEEYYRLVEAAIRMGFEYVARLLIEFGQLEVSILYNMDLWEEGKANRHTIGRKLQYIDKIPFDRHASHASLGYDRFGFKKHKKSACLLVWNDIMDRKQEARVAKWKKMLKWKYPFDNTILGYYRKRKWKSRLYKGIPYTIRAEAWKKMIPIQKLMKKNPGRYQQLLHQPPNAICTKIIDCDVMRQSREHRYFEERFSKEMISLFNILRAYSIYDEEVGYCQGMCSIAAALYIVLENEEEVFWALVHLMYSPKHRMRENFLPSFPLLQESYWIHDKLIEQDLTRLKKHFDSLSISSEFYSTKNYMTCFLDLFEFDTAIIIFDNFIMSGRKVLFSFSRCVLQQLSNKLQDASFETILPILQHLDTVEVDMQSLMSHKRLKTNRFNDLQKLYKKK